MIGYGATSGELFISGMVGERFAVRNSGATAVVEGIGDHGCEYMTGGTALVLGSTGRNFAAGMSGGVAYVLDLDTRKLNPLAVANDDLILEGPGEADCELIKDLLARHRLHTGSELAASLLADWPVAAARFTKVLPRDFAAVSQARNAAAHEGFDPDSATTWNRILEVTRG